MGTVYRKTATKPLPPAAELFTRKGQTFARWPNAKGKTRTAPVTTGRDGSRRITVEARTFTAKYRDGRGITHEVATGCRSEQAARAVLADLERRAELVKAGVVTPAEEAVADHQATPLAGHLADFQSHLKAKGATARHIGEVTGRLRTVAADCGFTRLADFDAGRVEHWLNRREETGAGGEPAT